jgi:hypothetical protein
MRFENALQPALSRIGHHARRAEAYARLLLLPLLLLMMHPEVVARKSFVRRDISPVLVFSPSDASAGARS